MDTKFPEKIGAGLLLSCKGEVLLLLRSGKHNANTWGLPGGNAESTDSDLVRTAVREAEEEMGNLPSYTILDSILTRRGKRGQKHYTVFIAEISPEDRVGYTPQLNHEHSSWKWFPISQVGRQINLHPVVQMLLCEEPAKERVWNVLHALDLRKQ